MLAPRLAHVPLDVLFMDLLCSARRVFGLLVVLPVYFCVEPFLRLLSKEYTWPGVGFLPLLPILMCKPPPTLLDLHDLPIPHENSTQTKRTYSVLSCFMNSSSSDPKLGASKRCYAVWNTAQPSNCIFIPRVLHPPDRKIGCRAHALRIEP